MKKGVLACLAMVMALYVGGAAHADHHNADKKDDVNFTLLLNTDTFFGFNPQFLGTKKMTDTVDFTFYGIQWSGGVGMNWGNWTEFGIGAAFKFSENLTFNPQLGIVNGNLTSAGGFAKMAEGVVPNFTLTYVRDRIESEIYAGWYEGVRPSNRRTQDFLHYWANAGYRFVDWIAGGGHYEHLRYMGGQNQPGNSDYDYYMALGPYVQFQNQDKSRFVRFMSGWDMRSAGQVEKSNYGARDFYKLTIGFIL